MIGIIGGAGLYKIISVGLSVIIPVGAGDETWKSILPDLCSLDQDDEIVFVSPEPGVSELTVELSRVGIRTPCRWIQSSPGRAKQLNLGAKEAGNENLWFLHCDSRISNAGVKNLKASISKNTKQILFFNLKFLDDGPRLISINEIGAWIRSRVLRLPFGDQGFCLSKVTFADLGGFDESAPYGEDHLLIWKAHQKGISIRCLGSGLKTSARKYSQQGWSKTTAQHVALTFRQAIPELIQLLRSRRSL